MKYLIAGKNGQLAQDFIRRFEERGVIYAAPDEAQLDITNENIVAEAVDSYKPDVVLNCAAYNLVDKAEEDPTKAFLVNSAGPQNLARAAMKQKALLVHFGSDYVFDGLKEDGLYIESDPVNPINQYGKSKLSGEELVRKECERFLILRLSWVFGPGKQNFVHKLRSWAENNNYLKVACDEFSVPTYTSTVVDCTMTAIEQGLMGKYHLTNSGYCSRYEWAKLILNVLKVDKFIRPVSMDSFALPAKRPRFSAMSNETIETKLNISIPSWEEAVSSFLQARR